MWIYFLGAWCLLLSADAITFEGFMLKFWPCDEFEAAPTPPPPLLSGMSSRLKKFVRSLWRMYEFSRLD